MRIRPVAPVNRTNRRSQINQANLGRIACVLLSLGMAAAACLAQTGSDRQAAFALEQQGRLAEAEAAWRAILKAHPNTAEPNAHIGLMEARQEHYREAVSYYRRALQLDPAMAGLRLNLGLALFKAGDLKAAAPEFEQLFAKAAPGSPEAERYAELAGMAYYGSGQYARAVTHLRGAAAANPSNLPLRLALAHSCLWSGQYPCVLDTYQQILELNAESAEADMLAGEALDGMKQHDKAIEEFRAAVKANPREPEAHFGLGYLLWTQRQYPEAVAEFQAELANDPRHVQSLAYMGDAYLQMNRYDDARPLMEKAAALDPGLALPHLDLGILNTEAGRNDDAMRELLVARRLEPDDVNVHWRLARLYRAMGRKEEAKAEFDKASSLNRKTDDALVEKISGGDRQPAPREGSPPAQDTPR